MFETGRMYETGMSKTAQFRFEPDRESATTAAPAPREKPAPPWERTHYRPSTRSTPMAFTGSMLAVCGLLSALLWLNVAPAPMVRHDLMLLDLSATPPPPPRQPPAPQQRQSAPRPNAPLIVAQPPIVPTLATPTVATTPPPDPQPTLVIAAPAAPAVPAAPAPAPTVASAGDLSSTMLSAKAPAYPLDSRRKHEEGTVVLKLLLSIDGRVSDISVARSSGSDRLDQAALAAVRSWRWKPMERNGEAVMVQGMVTIPFVLKR